MILLCSKETSFVLLPNNTVYENCTKHRRNKRSLLPKFPSSNKFHDRWLAKFRDTVVGFHSCHLFQQEKRRPFCGVCNRSERGLIIPTLINPLVRFSLVVSIAVRRYFIVRFSFFPQKSATGLQRGR